MRDRAEPVEKKGTTHILKKRKSPRHLGCRGLVVSDRCEASIAGGVLKVENPASNASARTRTENPLIKSQLLCQLSYGGGESVTIPAPSSSRRASGKRKMA